VAAILAHENTRKHLFTDTRVEVGILLSKRHQRERFPAKVFQTEQTVQLNGATIVLKHYAPAYTDSDISVHFTNADILHVADTFWNGHYPFIDYSTGGSIDGTIRATRLTLPKSRQDDCHPRAWSVGDKSQLTFYRDLLVTVRDKVAPSKAGRSLDEIVGCQTHGHHRCKVGRCFMGPRQFIGLVFEGV